MACVYLSSFLFTDFNDDAIQEWVWSSYDEGTDSLDSSSSGQRELSHVHTGHKPVLRLVLTSLIAVPYGACDDQKVPTW